MISWIKQKLTGFLVRYLNSSVSNYEPFAISSPETLESVLQVADIILVEGNQRFNTAVKYLTQSTWSHAAINYCRDANTVGTVDYSQTTNN